MTIKEFKMLRWVIGLLALIALELLVLIVTTNQFYDELRLLNEYLLK